MEYWIKVVRWTLGSIAHFRCLIDASLLSLPATHQLARYAPV